jgi:hypothetical protein
MAGSAMGFLVVVAVLGGIVAGIVAGISSWTLWLFLETRDKDPAVRCVAAWFLHRGGQALGTKDVVAVLRGTLKSRRRRYPRCWKMETKAYALRLARRCRASSSGNNRGRADLLGTEPGRQAGHGAVAQVSCCWSGGREAVS